MVLLIREIWKAEARGVIEWWLSEDDLGVWGQREGSQGMQSST